MSVCPCCGNGKDTDADVPRFCPNGCGETLVAWRPSDKELTQLKRLNPDNPHIKQDKTWIFKCMKCNQVGAGIGK